MNCSAAGSRGISKRLAANIARQKSEKKSMTFFDDNPSDSPEQEHTGRTHCFLSRRTCVSGESDPPARRRSYQLRRAANPSYTPRPSLPEDLRISWSWPHFFVFIFYALSSFFLVQMTLILYYAPHRSLPPKELERYLLNKPQFLFAPISSGTPLSFVSLRDPRRSSRCPILALSRLEKAEVQSLCWQSQSLGLLPLRLRLGDFCLHRQLAGAYQRQDAIEEVLKNRSSAMLLMAMAVLVAPLVEETVFRGYLYPLFAKSFGIVPGILLTGVLFGLMHGSQLGWTWASSAC